MSTFRKVRIDLGELDPNPARTTGSFRGYVGPPTSPPVALVEPEPESEPDDHPHLRGQGITADRFKPIPGIWGE